MSNVFAPTLPMPEVAATPFSGMEAYTAAPQAVVEQLSRVVTHALQTAPPKYNDRLWGWYPVGVSPEEGAGAIQRVTESRLAKDRVRAMTLLPAMADIVAVAANNEFWGSKAEGLLFTAELGIETALRKEGFAVANTGSTEDVAMMLSAARTDDGLLPVITVSQPLAAYSRLQTIVHNKSGVHARTAQEITLAGFTAFTISDEQWQRKLLGDEMVEQVYQYGADELMPSEVQQVQDAIASREGIVTELATGLFASQTHNLIGTTLLPSSVLIEMVDED